MRKDTKNIILQSLSFAYSETFILQIKSFMNVATLEDFENTYFTIPFDSNKTHSLQIHFYGNDTLFMDPIEAKEKQMVYVTLVEGSEFKPVKLLHYRGQTPCPACLDYVDMIYLKMILENFKTTLPLLKQKYEEASKKYSDLWKSWDTILTISHEIAEANK